MELTGEFSTHIEPNVANITKEATQEIQQVAENPIQHASEDAMSVSFMAMVHHVNDVSKPHLKKQFLTMCHDSKLVGTVLLAYAPLLKKKLKSEGTPMPYGKKEMKETYSAGRLEGASVFRAFTLALFGGTKDELVGDVKHMISEKLKVKRLAKLSAIPIGRYLANKITGDNLYPDVPKPVKDISSVIFFFFPDTWLALPAWQFMKNRWKSIKELKATAQDVFPIVRDYASHHLQELKNPSMSQAAKIFVPEST